MTSMKSTKNSTKELRVHVVKLNLKLLNISKNTSDTQSLLSSSRVTKDDIEFLQNKSIPHENYQNDLTADRDTNTEQDDNALNLVYEEDEPMDNAVTKSTTKNSTKELRVHVVKLNLKLLNISKNTSDTQSLLSSSRVTKDDIEFLQNKSIPHENYQNDLTADRDTNTEQDDNEFTLVYEEDEPVDNAVIKSTDNSESGLSSSFKDEVQRDIEFPQNKSIPHENYQNDLTADRDTNTEQNDNALTLVYEEDEPMGNAVTISADNSESGLSSSFKDEVQRDIEFPQNKSVPHENNLNNLTADRDTNTEQDDNALNLVYEEDEPMDNAVTNSTTKNSTKELRVHVVKLNLKLLNISKNTSDTQSLLSSSRVTKDDIEFLQNKSIPHENYQNDLTADRDTNTEQDDNEFTLVYEEDEPVDNAVIKSTDNSESGLSFSFKDEVQRDIEFPQNKSIPHENYQNDLTADRDTNTEQDDNALNLVYEEDEPMDNAVTKSTTKNSTKELRVLVVKLNPKLLNISKNTSDTQSLLSSSRGTKDDIEFLQNKSIPHENYQNDLTADRDTNTEQDDNKFTLVYEEDESVDNAAIKSTDNSESGLSSSFKDEVQRDIEFPQNKSIPHENYQNDLTADRDTNTEQNDNALTLVYEEDEPMGNAVTISADNSESGLSSSFKDEVQRDIEFPQNKNVPHENYLNNLTADRDTNKEQDDNALNLVYEEDEPMDNAVTKSTTKNSTKELRVHVVKLNLKLLNISKNTSDTQSLLSSSRVTKDDIEFLQNKSIPHENYQNDLTADRDTNTEQDDNEFTLVYEEDEPVDNAVIKSTDNAESGLFFSFKDEVQRDIEFPQNKSIPHENYQNDLTADRDTNTEQEDNALNLVYEEDEPMDNAVTKSTTKNSTKELRVLVVKLNPKLLNISKNTSDTQSLLSSSRVTKDDIEFLQNKSIPHENYQNDLTADRDTNTEQDDNEFTLVYEEDEPVDNAVIKSTDNSESGLSFSFKDEVQRDIEFPQNKSIPHENYQNDLTADRDTNTEQNDNALTLVYEQDEPMGNSVTISADNSESGLSSSFKDEVQRDIEFPQNKSVPHENYLNNLTADRDTNTEQDDNALNLVYEEDEPMDNAVTKSTTKNSTKELRVHVVKLNLKLLNISKNTSDTQSLLSSSRVTKDDIEFLQNKSIPHENYQNDLTADRDTNTEQEDNEFTLVYEEDEPVDNAVIKSTDNSESGLSFSFKDEVQRDIEFPQNKSIPHENYQNDLTADRDTNTEQDDNALNLVYEEDEPMDNAVTKSTTKNSTKELRVLVVKLNPKLLNISKNTSDTQSLLSSSRVTKDDIEFLQNKSIPHENYQNDLTADRDTNTEQDDNEFTLVYEEDEPVDNAVIKSTDNSESGLSSSFKDEVQRDIEFPQNKSIPHENYQNDLTADRDTNTEQNDNALTLVYEEDEPMGNAVTISADNSESGLSSPFKDEVQQNKDCLNNTLAESPIKTMGPLKDNERATSSDNVVILSSPVQRDGEPFEKSGSPEIFTEDKVSHDKIDQTPRAGASTNTGSPSTSLTLKKNLPRVRPSGRAAQMLGLCVESRTFTTNEKPAETEEPKKAMLTPDRRKTFLKLKKSLPAADCSPSGPILKRKMGETATESPSSKLKRVSFRDPPVSDLMSVHKYIGPPSTTKKKQGQMKEIAKTAEHIPNPTCAEDISSLEQTPSVQTEDSLVLLQEYLAKTFGARELSLFCGNLLTAIHKPV